MLDVLLTGCKIFFSNVCNFSDRHSFSKREGCRRPYPRTPSFLHQSPFVCTTTGALPMVPYALSADDDATQNAGSVLTAGVAAAL